MKMHGLGDGPYWLISYAYFLTISAIYILCFVIFGSVIGNIFVLFLLFEYYFVADFLSAQYLDIVAGLKFFRLNDYSIQFVFYFLYINLQISLAFLTAAWFSNVKTAAGIHFNPIMVNTYLLYPYNLQGSYTYLYFLFCVKYHSYCLHTRIRNGAFRRLPFSVFP